jgi:hypothetical protein
LSSISACTCRPAGGHQLLSLSGSESSQDLQGISIGIPE